MIDSPLFASKEFGSSAFQGYTDYSINFSKQTHSSFHETIQNP